MILIRGVVLAAVATAAVTPRVGGAAKPVGSICTSYPASSVVAFGPNWGHEGHCASKSGNVVNCANDPQNQEGCCAEVLWAGEPPSAQPWMKACDAYPICWMSGSTFWISCSATIDWY